MNEYIEDGMGFSGFAPDPSENLDELHGAALLKAATEYGVNQERAATEALARELGEKVGFYNWYHDHDCDARPGTEKWGIEFGLAFGLVWGDTQRECLLKALELLKEDS